MNTFQWVEVSPKTIDTIIVENIVSDKNYPVKFLDGAEVTLTGATIINRGHFGRVIIEILLPLKSEVPTDSEIEEEADDRNISNSTWCDGFEIGARWVRDRNSLVAEATTNTSNTFTGTVTDNRETQIPNIIELERERFEWASKTFPKATAESSLLKLIEEIKEVQAELDEPVMPETIIKEYADCLMCLFDSAGRVGILPEHIFEAFAEKLEINKNREWGLNPDNTYSHVKQS